MTGCLRPVICRLLINADTFAERHRTLIQTSELGRSASDWRSAWVTAVSISPMLAIAALPVGLIGLYGAVLGRSLVRSLRSASLGFHLIPCLTMCLAMTTGSIEATGMFLASRAMTGRRVGLTSRS